MLCSFVAVVTVHKLLVCRVGSQGLGRRKEGKWDLSGLHSLGTQLEKGGGKDEEWEKKEEEEEELAEEQEQEEKQEEQQEVEEEEGSCRRRDIITATHVADCRAL